MVINQKIFFKTHFDQQLYILIHFLIYDQN